MRDILIWLAIVIVSSAIGGAIFGSYVWCVYARSK